MLPFLLGALVTSSATIERKNIEMRTAYSDKGWLETPEPGCYGFALGYDFCAEHEYGAPAIKEFLGVPFKEIPIGIEDRTMTRVPQELRFFRYEHRSKDKRVKRTLPAALLVLKSIYSKEPENPAELAKQIGAELWPDFADKRRYTPEKHDIASAWSGHSGFAIHVRGGENVERLQALYDAFMAKDVSIASPSVTGFVRKSLCLVINSKFPQDVKEEVRKNDLAFLRLQTAFKESGIAELLKEKGKRFYALEPAWVVAEGGELACFLNPMEQSRYASGWYTLDDLLAWTEESGPIVDGIEIKALLDARDRDWTCHLIRGMNAQNVKARFLPKFVWLDKVRQKVGVVLHFYDKSMAVTERKVVPLEELEPLVEQGRQLAEAARLESGLVNAA